MVTLSFLQSFTVEPVPIQGMNDQTEVFTINTINFILLIILISIAAMFINKGFQHQRGEQPGNPVCRGAEVVGMLQDVFSVGDNK